MITYINSYDIATLGHNSNSTYTFATQGFKVYVEITDITPTPTPTPTPTEGISGGYIPKGVGRVIRKKEREKRQEDLTKKSETKDVVKKRIKVCVVIDNKEYCKTKIVKDRPYLKIDDVDIKINDKDTKPKITIKILK